MDKVIDLDPPRNVLEHYLSVALGIDVTFEGDGVLCLMELPLCRGFFFGTSLHETETGVRELRSSTTFLLRGLMLLLEIFNLGTSKWSFNIPSSMRAFSLALALSEVRITSNSWGLGMPPPRRVLVEA